METSTALKNRNYDSWQNKVVLGCAFTIIFIGLFVLAGWAMGSTLETRVFSKKYIPMAEETALLFLFAGIALAFMSGNSKSRIWRYIFFCSATFIGSVALLSLFDFGTGYKWNLSNFIGPQDEFKGGIATGIMSWLTSICFLFVSLALVLLTTKARKYSTILSSMVLFTGYIIVVGYSYGVPFLYSGTTIPMAWPTAIAFIVTSAGLLLACGKNNPPVSYFLEDSTRSRLLRSILPVIFLLMLIGDFIGASNSKFYDNSTALTNCIVDILILILTGFIISRLSSSIGHSIDENAAELKKAVEEARINEEYFRNIFEYSTIGKSITEIGGKVKTNKAFRQMLGYTENEIQKIDWQEITHPDDIKRDQEYGRSMISGEISSRRWEKRYIHKEGHVIWADLSTVLQRDTEGKPLYFITSIQDITERKRAEEDLKKSEERYRSLLTNLEAGIVVHAPDTSIVMNNHRASELLGLNEDQLLGKLAVDPRWKFIHENNIPFRLEEYPVNRIIETRIAFNDLVLGVIRPATNDIVWLNVSGFPVFGSNGNISEILVSFIDITQRKLAEETLSNSEIRMRTLVHTIPDLVWLKDTNGVYQSCNGIFERFYGAREADITGKTDYDFVDRELADFFRENDIKAIEVGKPTTNEEWVTFADNGYRALLETTKTPMFDSKGKIIGVLGIGHDITERKKTEEEIREQLDELRRWYEVTLDREGRVLELKKEVNELLKQWGEPLKYGSTNADTPEVE